MVLAFGSSADVSAQDGKANASSWARPSLLKYVPQAIYCC